MPKIFMFVFLFSMIMMYSIGNVSATAFDNLECFQTLQSAKLELSDKQINNACEEITVTGETFIEDFRDRGLLIKFITLGETVSIPFY